MKTLYISALKSIVNCCLSSADGSCPLTKEDNPLIWDLLGFDDYVDRFNRQLMQRATIIPARYYTILRNLIGIDATGSIVYNPIDQKCIFFKGWEPQSSLEHLVYKDSNYRLEYILDRKTMEWRKIYESVSQPFIPCALLDLENDYILADIKNTSLAYASIKKEEEMNNIFHAKEEATIYNSRFYYRKIIFSPPATIVIWADGDKTMVRCESDEPYDPEKGLALCFMKRAFFDSKVSEYHKLLRKETQRFYDQFADIKDSPTASNPTNGINLLGETLKRAGEQARKNIMEIVAGGCTVADETILYSYEKSPTEHDEIRKEDNEEDVLCSTDTKE